MRLYVSRFTLLGRRCTEYEITMTIGVIEVFRFLTRIE